MLSFTDDDELDPISQADWSLPQGEHWADAERTDDHESYEDDTEPAMKFADDAVGMYFSQMGQLPLLSRRQELNIARKIDRSRALFRATLFSSEFMLRGAVRLLRDNQLRLYRKLDVQVNDVAAAKRQLGRHLRKIEKILRGG